MATTNSRGQCALEAAVIMLVFAAILLSFYGLADVSRNSLSGAVLSKEHR